MTCLAFDHDLRTGRKVRLTEEDGYHVVTVKERHGEEAERYRQVAQYPEAAMFAYVTARCERGGWLS